MGQKSRWFRVVLTVLIVTIILAVLRDALFGHEALHNTATGDGDAIEPHEFDPMSAVPSAAELQEEAPVALVATAPVTAEPSLNPKLKVAVAVAITIEPKIGGYLDGTAVLRESVKRHTSEKYPDIEYIALCGPNADKWKPESLELVKKAGWTIHKVEIPVKTEDIKGDYLRQEMPKSGCCGPAELIKLEIFRFTEYDRIIILDADTLLFQPIDELFEDEQHDAIWTVDRNLGGNCVNGGWLVLSPAKAVYEKLVDIVREGDFREGSAWGGKNVGWCYGGQTFQGVIPYYFQYVHKDAKGPEDEKKYWREADSCIYNNMGDNTNEKGRDQATVPVKEVKTAHFTVCQKPWDFCWIGQGKPLCQEFHEEWWKVRNQLEKENGLHQSDRCDNGQYKPLDIYTKT